MSRALRLVALTAVFALAGCTSTSKTATPKHASPAVVTVTATVSASASESPAVVGPSSSPPAARSASAASAVASVVDVPAQDALVTPAIRAQLLASYLKMKGFAADQVTGTVPGGVYYAYLPSTNTYWAAATFQIAPNATEATGVAMQDGGAGATYVRVGAGPWQITPQGEPWPCPGDIPPSVLGVWHLSIVDGCVVAEAISPSHDAQTLNATFNDLPDGTYFGDIIYADVDYSGQGSMQFDAITWVGSAPPVNKVHNLSNLNFDPSAVASYSVGTGAANSHVVVGTIDKAFIENVGTSIDAFSKNLTFGYEVTVKDSTIVNIQAFGPLTPSPANPNFTEPTS